MNSICTTAYFVNTICVPSLPMVRLILTQITLRIFYHRDPDSRGRSRNRSLQSEDTCATTFVATLLQQMLTLLKKLIYYV